MKKTDQIDNCFHCPLKKHRDGWGNFCEHVAVDHYEIMNIQELPDWCPLPDDKQTCLRCGWEFMPGAERNDRHPLKIIGARLPKTCPNCRSPYWMKPRQVKESKDIASV
jgi:DNA-directed RNA polymerase subunit RPC12/RpoP